MDGFATLDRLKADAELRDIPVVIRTSKVLEAEDYDRIGGHGGTIVTKENSSRKKASGELRDALRKAGVRVLDGVESGAS
jgi:CheY-like chemotaxis protein